MKKKLILIALLGTIMSFIIYFYTATDEITIVSLGDGLASGMTPYNIEGYSFNDYLKESYKIKHNLAEYYEFARSNLTTRELIYEIKENVSRNFKNETIKIQQAINKADILTVAIGLDELSKVKVNSTIRKTYEQDLTELLSMLKMLNQKKVIVLGIYPHNELDILNASKINAIIRDIALSNDFTFLDINNVITKDNFLNNTSPYINYEGHKRIYELLKTVL